MTEKDSKGEEIELPPKLADSIKTLPKSEQERITEKYKKARYEWGEAVGVVAAQSIAEPATQTTLRAYHITGRTQLVTTTGLPRLLEVFDARRIPTTPTMEIYLDKEHDNRESARQIAAQIKATILKQIIEEATLDLNTMRVEIKLSKPLLEDHQLKAEEIIDITEKSIKNVSAKAKGEIITIETKKAELSIKDLQSLRNKVRNLHVKGIRGIEQAIVDSDKKTGRWVIKTLGSNLKKILKMPGVDSIKTTTNNVHEIAAVLGIEAARNAIIREILTTMREQGVDTDARHVLLVADAMCRDGSVKAIGRYGVAGEKASVLSRANFEETIKHLTIAAAAGEEDPLLGIIENIIVGNLAPIGTGLIRLKMKGKAKKKI